MCNRTQTWLAGGWVGWFGRIGLVLFACFVRWLVGSLVCFGHCIIEAVRLMEIFKQHPTTKNNQKPMVNQQKQTIDCCLSISVKIISTRANRTLPGQSGPNRRIRRQCRYAIKRRLRGARHRMVMVMVVIIVVVIVIVGLVIVVMFVMVVIIIVIVIVIVVIIVIVIVVVMVWSWLWLFMSLLLPMLLSLCLSMS